MSEFQEHRDLVRWFRTTYPQYGKCIRLSLNGVNLPMNGSKAAMVVNQFKSQGMVKGESDLFFAVPNLTYHGLFIEMKAEGGKATPEQLEYIEFMLSLQYEAVVLEGAKAAKEFIADYMKTSFIAIG